MFASSDTKFYPFRARSYNEFELSICKNYFYEGNCSKKVSWGEYIGVAYSVFRFAWQSAVGINYVGNNAENRSKGTIRYESYCKYEDFDLTLNVFD
jgi:hypothetical protein